MISSAELVAIGRIVAGDESVAAAQALEGLILEYHLDDERYEHLLDTLSLYSPGQGRPYVAAAELRRVLSDFLAQDESHKL